MLRRRVQTEVTDTLCSTTGSAGLSFQLARELHTALPAWCVCVSHGCAQALLVELLELKAHHAKAAESRTLVGHLRNALGYAMSGYCVYRVLASFKALLVGEDFSSDPVSRWVGRWVEGWCWVWHACCC